MKLKYTSVLSLSILAFLCGCTTFDASLKDFPKAPATPSFSKPYISKIAFGSCQQIASETKTFDTIYKRSPDVFLMLGDNVYGDYTPDDPMQSGMRATYWQLSKNPSFKNIISKVTTFTTWDDHDYGDQDAGNDFKFRKTTEKMFETFWNLENNDLAKRGGIYQSYLLGDDEHKVQFIIFDTRFFRDKLLPSDDINIKGKERYMSHPIESKASMLGDNQWKWFENELRKPAKIRIIVSSIQLVADGNGFEAWEKFPAERQKFYDLIAKTKAQGVVVLSGDRHHASINVSKNTIYPIYDFTSSPFSGSARSGDNEIAPNRIYVSPKEVLNFGEVEIDWVNKNIFLNVLNQDGQMLHKEKIEFSKIETKKAPN